MRSMLFPARRGAGEKQAASFVRSMSRRKHASEAETKALADMIASMVWERKVSG